MSSQVENILKVYRTLAKIPACTGGLILNDGKNIISKWTQRNLERKQSSKIAFNYLLNDQLDVVSDSGFGVDVGNELLSKHSPSESLKAIIKDQTETAEKKVQYLEIWKSRYLSQCIDLSALEIHGDVYADSEFGSLEWSADEKYVAYIAERKITKSEPFYKRKPIKTKKEDDSGETPIAAGKEYEYKQDWGEQLVGKYLSVIVVCELETETFTIIDTPSSWCPGQILWAPDSKSLVGVAWMTEPRRLGLIFCTNRPSVIFHITLDGSYSIITEEKVAPRSPRFSLDHKQLVWLQRPTTGPHHMTMQLVGTSWPLSEKPKLQTLVDIVDKGISIENNDNFFGIYCLSLPKNAFSSDSKRIIFSTPQQNEIRIFVFNLENRKLTDISYKSDASSTSVLDVRGDIILATKSSIKQPSQLIIARLPKEGEEKTLVWRLIGNPTPTPQELANLNIEYLHLKHENVKDAVDSFTAIFFGPTHRDKPVPLIVWPHGGPHSSFANSFSLESAFFALLGFACLQVNYRGSVGAGQKSVDFLPSRIGDADVKDCKLATDASIRSFDVGKSAVGLFGGSHGGFLVTHLSGQYPDAYHAVVTRNPVIDAASMINTTDIPDWYEQLIFYHFYSINL